jgi:tape measure domain-containing protein
MALGSDLMLRLIISAQDATGNAVRTAREGIQSISTTAQQVYESVKTYLTYKISLEGAQELLALGDQYENLKARVKLATDSQDEFNAAQTALFEIAQETRSDLESTVTLYTKTEGAVKRLGGTQRDSFDLTRAVAEAFKVSGASAQESSSGIQQLSQALASGVLRGDEFNSVMESSPRLAQALADGMGQPISKLRSLAEAGELTADKVVKALLSQKDAIAAEYAQMPLTVEGAMQQAENSLLRYVGQLNESTGATQRVAGGIQFLAGHLEDLAGVAKTLAEVYGINLVRGLVQATAAKIADTQATRVQAAATAAAAAEATAAIRAELLQHVANAEAQVAEMRARIANTESLIAHIRAQGGSIATSEALVRLQQQLLTQRNALTAATVRQAEAEAALQASMRHTAEATALSQKAMTALNWTFGGLTALFVGWEIGQFLNKFEKVRFAGSFLGETLAKLGVTWDVFTGKLTAEQGKKELERIPLIFDDIRKTSTDAYQEGEKKAAEFRQAQKELAGALEQTGLAAQGMAGDTQVTAEKLAELKAKVDQAKTALDAKTEALGKVKEGTAQYATAQGAAKQAAEAVKAAAEQYSKALTENVKQAQEAVKAETDRSAVLKSGFDTLKAVAEAEREAALASGDVRAALEKEGELRRLAVQEARQTLAAKEEERQAAMALVEALLKQAAAQQGGDDTLKKAIVTAEKDLVVKQQQSAAAKAHAQSLDKLPDSLANVTREQALTNEQVSRYEEAARGAISQAQLIGQAFKNGKAIQAEYTAAQDQAQKALGTYTAALKLHTQQLEARESAASRVTSLDQQRYQAVINETQARIAAAKAVGDEAEALRLTVELKKLEAQAAQQLANDKAAEAQAALAVAEAKAKEYAANGELTVAEQAAIQAARDHAEAKRLEAQQSQSAADIKRTEAAATEKQAEAAQKAAKSTREQTDAQDGANAAASNGASIIDVLAAQLAQYGESGVQALLAMQRQATTFEESWRAAAFGEKLLADAKAQADGADALIARIQDAANGTGNLSEALASARTAVAGLDGQPLDQLQAAIDQAEQKLQSLRDSAEATKTALQGELVNLTGSGADKLAFDFQQKKLDLQQRINEAQALGDAATMAALSDALRLLEEVNAVKERNLKIAEADNAAALEGNGIVEARTEAEKEYGQVAEETAKKVGDARAQAEEDYAEALGKAAEDSAEATQKAMTDLSESMGRVIAKAADDTMAVAETFRAAIDKIKADAASFDTGIEDSIRALRRQGMSEEEARADRVMELREKIAAAQKAIAAGDLDEAQRLRDQIAQIAEGLGSAVTGAFGKIILGQEEAARQAIGYLEDAQKLNDRITETRMEQARREQAAKLAGIEAEKQAELEKARVVADNALKKRDDDHRDAMAKIEQQLEKDLDRVRTVANADLAEAQKVHNAKMAQIETERQARENAVNVEAPQAKTKGGITARAQGGPVRKGEDVFVAEEGVETFVDENGEAYLIGTDGPGLFNPPADGYVFPNNGDNRAAVQRVSGTGMGRSASTSSSHSVGAMSGGAPRIVPPPPPPPPEPPAVVWMTDEEIIAWQRQMFPPNPSAAPVEPPRETRVPAPSSHVPESNADRPAPGRDGSARPAAESSSDRPTPLSDGPTRSASPPRAAEPAADRTSTSTLTIRLELVLPGGKTVPATVDSRFKQDLLDLQRAQRSAT